MPLRRVKRSRLGGYVVRLPPAEREVLGSLPPMLRGMLSEQDPEDPAIRRLFPSAFLDDEKAAADFDSVVRDDLMEQRLAAIETLERTVGSDRLSEEELSAWLASVNDLRLVLGVRLAVTEESTPDEFGGDPETEQAYGLYAYLSYLEEEMVEALAGG
ncbi:MAG TPA: DUF2017 family protein [Actinomycetota bacterium]|nr:DUF2017 family protein [Actinomycetota bacterium]